MNAALLNATSTATLKLWYQRNVKTRQNCRTKNADVMPSDLPWCINWQDPKDGKHQIWTKYVPWEVRLASLIQMYWYFGGTCYLHFHGRHRMRVLPKHGYSYSRLQCAKSQKKYILRVCSCEKNPILLRDPRLKECILIRWCASRKFNIFGQNYE
jgi:hypothetical protein